MECRPGCGACCIAPSISSLDKPAGEPCRHLDAELRCRLFGLHTRPRVCVSLRPGPDLCGADTPAAFALLARLESATRPGMAHG